MQIESQKTKIGDFAEDINTLFRELVRSSSEAQRINKSTVITGFNLGKILLKVKSMLGHGKWLKWLSDNCEISHDVASDLMNFASSRNLGDLNDYKSLSEAFRDVGILPKQKPQIQAIGTGTVDITQVFVSKLTKQCRSILSRTHEIDMPSLPEASKEELRAVFREVEEAFKPIIEVNP